MQQFTFAEFLAKFPPVSMPIVLGEDTHHVFSMENEPLPEGMVARFILPLDPEPADEFTEYVPCFAIEDTERFIALVWWKAGLMQYEYVLATFNDKGEPLDRRVIAHTRVRDGKVLRAVATIDEDWVIYIAEGESSDGEDHFDPTTSRTYDLELMLDGTIG